MATTYLKKTFDGAEASTKGTFSFWVKRSKIGAEQYLYINSVYGSSSATRGEIRFDGDDKLRVRSLNSGSATNEKVTSMVFRDTNAWYHIVVTLDYTNASSSNYQKIYVNGNELTDFSTNSNTSTTNQFFQGSDLNGQLIGKSNGSEYLDGCLSHYHCVVGTVYTPSTFGETDSTTGEWKIKTNPGISTVNYGAAGFFVLKDGNSMTDQSGNGNNFTLGGGTLTKTEDNPSNVFATLNPLDKHIGGTQPTISNGNNTWSSSGAGNSNCAVKGTIGASSGKYYFEAKFTAQQYTNLGMSLVDGTNGWNGDGDISAVSSFYGIQSSGSKRVAGTGTSSVFTALSNNDIGMFAYDFDNNKFWFGVNGSWVASGNPTTGANSLGTLASGTYLPSISNGHWGNVSTAQLNFGNGYFGTTAVSSAGTNASGNGIFEHDCPNGYTALSTKGLNL